MDLTTRSIHMTYLKLCLPLSARPIIGFSIVVLNFVTDWVGYTAYKSLQVREQVVQRFPRNRTSNSQRVIFLGYYELTAIYFYACIVASFIFFLHITWLYYSFLLERRRHLNKKDGFIAKETVMNKYGGELLLLMQTLLENVPVMVVLFLSKAFLTCQFMAVFNNSIFLVIIVATVINVIWKFGAVIWNSGCFGCFEEYYSGRVYSVIRILTVFVLLICSVFTCLNLILYFPQLGEALSKNNPSKHIPFQGLNIENWINQDKLVITVQEMDNITNITNMTTTSDSSTNSIISQSGILITNHRKYHYLTVCSLSDLMYTNRKLLTYSLPCSFNNISLIGSNETHMHKCELLLKMYKDSNTQEIHYSVQFKYDLNQKCTEGYLAPQNISTVGNISVRSERSISAIPKNTDTINTTVAPGRENKTVSHTTPSAGQRSSKELPWQHMHFNVSFISNYVTYCTAACDYAFIYNEDLLSYDFCY